MAPPKILLKDLKFKRISCTIENIILILKLHLANLPLSAAVLFIKLLPVSVYEL